ncbi:tRNA cyclic N6-threonylcarbamoyladenosine(37) synthase TcdA [Aliidiomarina maris]|uniref:tRNA threonylcarbamoyladenosine dehydratase n=1 Tax=Aliidiomarina maris TaxID=531312 RepID=A0A327X6B5_9GAMM|nr:tRNA cyclic N6-threonylcarbamoyladenosine(37) synthase TcdA [Aliidiomarina maris]MBA3988085.1 tRNA cyclic N6-threonylcarbamoyladenosine(37) synthase TcdA [Idiomarina sp.]RAK00653.1 tRNA A37 threonylcarbamoyladenosine dehydratase [Aliidiomarina maris]RUO27339.1 tRNA cyclic N6-threonylcarbamoyladenosine(37) synthase TcdA [Aliidiomarina maris]
MDNYQRRFGGIQRLYGDNNAAAIQGLHIVVIGLGGVGSWAAEALARSGVGKLTLIDMDEVCLSNINRQSHALTNTVGQSKIAVVAERLRQINPELDVVLVDDFIDANNMAEYLTAGQPDGVLDAIDSIGAKTALLAWCKRNKVRVVTTGGAGGQIDPSQIQVADIAKVVQDPLMAKVRSQLRRDYHFTTNPKRKFGIDCVYSTEQLRYPTGDGRVSYAKPGSSDTPLNCSTGFGASMMVTASFGLQAAATLLNRLIPEPKPRA